MNSVLRFRAGFVSLCYKYRWHIRGFARKDAGDGVMKTKVLFLLLPGCLLALTAWLVHVPNPTQANDVPEKYRDTVYEGLEYLVKNQFKDGHWEGDDGKHPVAMTGLVGLALLMERKIEREDGRRPTDGKAKYSANIRKAVDWLMDKSQAERDGLIFSDHPSETPRYMQGHGLATLFLAGACKYEHDDVRQKKLNGVLIGAVKYIVKAQSTQGGWYHTSKVEGHDFDTISATVIQIQALQAAENVGIPVPNEVIKDAQEYLKMALAKNEKGNCSRSAGTAGALVCRYHNSSRRGGPDELIEKWFKYCQTEIPVNRAIQFGRDELTHYYYAQAQCYLGGDTWGGYRTAMFDYLQSSQNKDGSWPASDGISVGPVYSTALWCTVLQLDKKSHPSRERELPIVTTRGPEPWAGPRFGMMCVREQQA
jgi:Prenyltransferase and squalene oxidase repeat